MDYNEHPMDNSSGCEFQWTLVDKIFSPSHIDWGLI